MQKTEFEEIIEKQISDADYEVIEFVYQFHPVVSETSGKEEVAELYKSFGMVIFRDMYQRAEMAKELEEKIQVCRMELEKLTGQYEELRI